MVEFTQHSNVTLYKSNASDLDVARAAWVSQNAEAHEKEAEPGRIEGLINFLYKNKHMSPFEHGQFTFIVDTPIFVAREFMRHRTFSFNEISGRYTEMRPVVYLCPIDRPMKQSGKVGNYVFETDRKMNTDLYLEDKEITEFLFDRYQKRIERGYAKEVSRNILPLNMMTSFWATVNPRNLMHFLKLRTDPTALYEIREVAGQMEKAFEQQMPMTYKAWRNNN